MILSVSTDRRGDGRSRIWIEDRNEYLRDPITGNVEEFVTAFEAEQRVRELEATVYLLTGR